MKGDASGKRLPKRRLIIGPFVYHSMEVVKRVFLN